ncbi:NHL repeat-containing protein [Tahibacter aquaticus]|uniref:NHL repeat-containing protein n=1 Tax=Tahibacter aquaticus TaxID=520092 RepID=A0A4R6Z533_9GAMM|nr:hypothetical protein [Tahibacter aquaticus]TDR46792.1 NHL repeat-containing protein [Tahibacter aquaticus]
MWIRFACLRTILGCAILGVAGAGSVVCAQTIATVAGSGTGDSGPARNAQFSSPTGAALDSAGNLFIADSYGSRIRKVDIHGTVTTVAGNGALGFSGDGGRATSAALNQPAAVAVDLAGNLYIADSKNFRVRKVDTHGTITTLAGGGPNLFSDGGPATNAALNVLSGVAVDGAGNVYVADHGMNVVRKIDAVGIITTIVGSLFNFAGPGYSGDGGPATSATLYWPSGLARDSAGSLYVADTGNHRIRKINPQGTITTVVGIGVDGFFGDGGAATNAGISSPTAVTVGANGNFFVVDTGNKRVRKINATGMIGTVAGSGSGDTAGYGHTDYSGAATSMDLNPAGAVVDASGNLYIVDSVSAVVRRVDAAGLATTIAGIGSFGYSGNGGAATSARLSKPTGVGTDAAGNLYIADTYNHVIRKVDIHGTISTVAGNGYMQTSGFGAYGGYSGDGGAATNARLFWPAAVAVDAVGNLYIADTANNRIRKVNTSNVITTIAGGGSPPDGLGDGGPATSAALSSPSGVVISATGNIYIADSLNLRVRKVSTNGTITTVAGGGSPPDGIGDGGPATSAALWPTALALDPGGNLHVLDFYHGRVRKIGAGGTIATVAGGGGAVGSDGDGGAATNASFLSPHGIAIDAVGNLYIADFAGMIRKVSASGTITTVVGGADFGYSGDGGQATLARVYWPYGLAVNSPGDLYVADSSNNVVRKVLFGEIFKDGFDPRN